MATLLTTGTIGLRAATRGRAKQRVFWRALRRWFDGGFARRPILRNYI